MSLADALSGIDTLNLIALGAVVFIGLLHGAMDGALAAHFGWMESKKKAASFLLDTRCYGRFGRWILVCSTCN